MLTTRELLAAVKTANSIPSNYRLARALDVPENTVQRWSTGRNLPDDTMCARLAAMAGLDAGYVVASVHAERAAAGPLRDLWASMAQRVKDSAHGALTVALAVILSLFVGGGPDAGAMAAQVTHANAPSSTENQSVYYVNLLRWLRRLKRTLKGIFSADRPPSFC